MFAQAPVPQPPATPPPAAYAGDDGNGVDGPSEKRRKQEDSLKTRRGLKLDRFAECVVVQVDYEKAVSYKNGGHTQTLQAICGRYYKVGMLDGHPVYRQERGVPIMGANKLVSEKYFKLKLISRRHLTCFKKNNVTTCRRLYVG